MGGSHRRQSGRAQWEFPDGELGTWAALGDVTDRSVRVWLRDDSGLPQTARLRIDGEVAAEAVLEPDPQRDHVAAGMIQLPEPAPDAEFAVEVARSTRRGRLAPTAGAPAAFSFAFASCHEPFQDSDHDGRLEVHPGAAIYPRMRELLTQRAARFLVLDGDQVYSDPFTGASVRDQISVNGVSNEELVDRYRHLYRGYLNQRGFRELGETFPTYMMWDDHDIFEGWGSLLATSDLDRRLYRAARTAYQEYQHLRNPGGALDDQPPFAYHFWYADAGFFVLDLRGCRDHQERRILGDPQWAALDAFLDEADARGTATVFIVASVPVIHIAPALAAALQWIPTKSGTDVRDRWSVDAFRPEREALLERLFAWQTARPKRQVAILSGDVHVAAAFRVRQRGGRGRLVQWTSSALTTPLKISHRVANGVGTALGNLGEHSVRVRLEGMVAQNNFGLVEVAPQPEGGHALAFSVFAYDAKRGTLRRALHLHAPRPR